MICLRSLSQHEIEKVHNSLQNMNALNNNVLFDSIQLSSLLLFVVCVCVCVCVYVTCLYTLW
jgi:hypothetical protein